jgi:hypothetical protein
LPSSVAIDVSEARTAELGPTIGARARAILAIVDDRNSLDGIEDLDEQTLARLAGLDGATIVDRDADLLAYGAIVAGSDS